MLYTFPLFYVLTTTSRGSLVEYTHKVSENNDDVEMVQACEDCRIAVVRKREPDGGKVRMMTSVWVFSDDNTIRMELKMEDGEMYVPYSSYFTPEKISITVPCELKYHDVQYGIRASKVARTRWINYVFEDSKGRPRPLPIIDYLQASCLLKTIQEPSSSKTSSWAALY